MRKDKFFRLLITIVLSVITLTIPFLQNVITDNIPIKFQHYTYLALPLFVLLGIVFVWINIRQMMTDSQNNKTPTQVNLPAFKSLSESKETQMGFWYDVYISYANEDKLWVETILLPKLVEADLSFAISDQVGIPGIPVVKNIEEGIRHSKRTLIVISSAYLRDNMAEFENTLAQTLGIQEGNYRLLPIKISANINLPMRLEMLTSIDFSNHLLSEIQFRRLIGALRTDLPAYN